MATRTTVREDKTDAITKAFDRLAKELSERSRLRANIRQSEDNFIYIPKNRTPEEAAKILKDYVALMEKEESKLVEWKGHAGDILVAINAALEKLFGEVLGEEFHTFFGTMPGKTVSVKVDYNKTVKVPIESISVPGLDKIVKIYINPKPNEKSPMNGLVQVQFTFLRKNAPVVEDIESAINYQLENHSIFRGKSIDSGFDFLNLKSTVVKKLVYAESVERDLRAMIYSIIDKYKEILADGDTIKRTVLFSGGFGTGKTLTTLAVAMYANERGWTYILVKTGDKLVDALTFAKKFQPCVVSIEDVDMEASGERTYDLNSVLERIDGGLDKDDQILLILTTNHPERISQAMFRPGRIDWEIDMNKLDMQAVSRLVKVYGGRMIEGELDGDALWNQGSKLPHAFISGAVHAAKSYAFADGREKIRTDDVVNAMIGLEPQYQRMLNNDYKVTPTIDVAMTDLVSRATGNGGNEVRDILDELRQKIEEVHDHVV